jgi:hypothetical protein
MWKSLRLKTWHFWLIGACLFGFLAVIAFILRDDIKRDSLDPKIPFQIYAIPEKPDYSKDSSWFLNPSLSRYYADPRKVDVFFVHGTSFDGGKHWLGPIGAKNASREVIETQLPNYAAPFAVMGNIYAPKYRQASLYSQFSLHEDAREAREYPYRDVEAAFKAFLKNRDGGKGFGLEQGGLLAERLLIDAINADPAVRTELIAAYLIETPVPVELTTGATPACSRREQSGCLISYLSVDFYRPDTALTILQRSVQWQWSAPGSPRLIPINGAPVVCVNPLMGAQTDEPGDARLSLGAANATGLEWPTQPALIAHKVTAQCKNGLLIVSKPSSQAFDVSGSWETRKKVRNYNLFYGDLQADFKARLLDFQARPTVAPAP